MGRVGDLEEDGRRKSTNRVCLSIFFPFFMYLASMVVAMIFCIRSWLVSI